MKGKRSIRIVLLGIFSMLLAPLATAYPVYAADGGPVFSLASASGQPTAVGGNLTVDIRADGVSDMVAFEMTLTVDPQIWSFVGAVSSQPGYKATPLPELRANGVITFTYAKIGDAAGENGSVNLGHVTLEAKAKGNGRIVLSEVRLVDSEFASADYAPNVSLEATIVGGGNPGTGNPGDNPGDGNSNGNGGGQPNDEEPQIVNEDSLKPDGSGKTVIEIAGGKKEVLLPANAAAIADMKRLEFRSGDFFVEIDSAVLNDLTGLLDEGELEGATISFKLERATEDEEASLVGHNPGSSVSVKAGGAIYRIDLSIVTKDGKESKPDSFETPVELSLPYEEGADESVLGIYYFNESTKAWEYVGGTLDKSGKRITVLLSHFSTYGVLEYHKTFSDVPAGHWAFGAIRSLAAKHVANGVSDTRFAPGSRLTRAEFAALLVRALGLKPAAAAAPFADVPSGSWYAGAVAAAREGNLISGQSPNRFAPTAPITREEMAAMLVRAYEFGTGAKAEAGQASFADEAFVSEWAAADVRKALGNGLMNGTGGGNFAPAGVTTRAEAAAAVYNLLTKLESYSAG